MLHSRQLMVVIFILPLIFLNCKEKNKYTTQLSLNKNEEKIEVDTSKARISKFVQEFSTNGILKAEKKYQLISPVHGMLKNLLVVPGQNVKKGDTIALLENNELEIVLKEKELKLNKASIDLEDFLLGYNYTLEDSSIVPEKIWNTACSKVGYDQALIEYQKAKSELENLVIKSLFAGFIANINVLPGQQISKGEVLCNVFYLDELICEFALMEEDFKYIKNGQMVNITPLSLNMLYQGFVYAKNPEINEDGLFTVYAKLNNTNHKLVSGMHVQLNLLIEENNELIIPKEALVTRNDDNIVFTLEKGKAKWNFVEVSKENSNEVAISSGLEAGDIVITKGNLFLNEGSSVIIKKSSK